MVSTPATLLPWRKRSRRVGRSGILVSCETLCWCGHARTGLKEEMFSVTTVWLRRSAMALTIGASMFFTVAAKAADDISGIWLTAERDGHVEIKPCGDALCGYIATILDPAVPPDARDLYNEDSKLRSRPICGLKILG